MKLEDALRKIKACWARAKSTTSDSEAQIALRHAIALMAEFGLDEGDVKASEVNELEAKSGGAEKPPEWEAVLAAGCAKAFECKCLFSRRFDGKRLEIKLVWVFVGIEPGTTQAQYAFEVLFKRCKQARAEYIKANLKRCKPSNKTARGNLFAEGWVQKVTSHVWGYQRNPTHEEAIAAYLEKEKPNMTSLETRQAKPAGRNANDRHAGIQAGNGVAWTKGVGRSDENQPRRISHES